MTTHPYLLANAETQAGDRFKALSALYDGSTFKAFDQVGIKPGWKCWEVGAGGPFVPEGMAARCQPGGYVLATDIDINWVARGQRRFDVRQHDVAAELPPFHDFDLAHARLVLSHVPERESGLANMVASLKRGGFLILEDFDSVLTPRACLDPLSEGQNRANRIRAGFLSLLEQRGVDRAYGSKLARLMRESGLMDVSVEARFPVSHSAGCILECANAAQTALGLIKIGAATETEISAHLSAMEKGDLDIVFPAMFTAIGRKV
jgi:SAM-dependent methyltransferase